MKPLLKSMIIPALFMAVPFVMADSEKDCLLEGTVLHGEQAGQEAPSGSDVKYRYRTDESGQSETQLISVGA